MVSGKGNKNGGPIENVGHDPDLPSSPPFVKPAPAAIGRGGELSVVVLFPTCVIGDPSPLIRHACLRLAGSYLSVILFSPLVGSGAPS